MNTSNTPFLIALVVVVLAAIAGAVLSPANIIQIVGFAGVIAAGLFQIMKQNSTAIKVEEADVKIEAVKVTLAETSKENKEHLGKIETTGEKVHTLVNSNMGVQLRVNAILARRVADLTIDPLEKSAAIKAAELAESLLHEHEEKQAVVDNKDGKETEATIFEVT